MNNHRETPLPLLPLLGLDRLGANTDDIAAEDALAVLSSLAGERVVALLCCRAGLGLAPSIAPVVANLGSSLSFLLALPTAALVLERGTTSCTRARLACTTRTPPGLPPEPKNDVAVGKLAGGEVTVFAPLLLLGMREEVASAL